MEYFYWEFNPANTGRAQPSLAFNSGAFSSLLLCLRPNLQSNQIMASTFTVYHDQERWVIVCSGFNLRRFNQIIKNLFITVF